MKKKNIVILYTDQQRYDSLACNGNQYARTPNIDQLVEDSCNFKRHICTNPSCMPSRASFLTGMYVPGHGVSSNGIPLYRREKGKAEPANQFAKSIFGMEIPDKVPTIADILKEAGYQTALFGKLHTQPSTADIRHHMYESYAEWEQEEIVGVDKNFYGFDHVRMVLGHGEAPLEYNKGHYARWLQRNHSKFYDKVMEGPAFRPNGVVREDIYESNLPIDLHNTMWLAHETSQYIEKHANEDAPMLLFVGFPDPHHAFVPPTEIAKEFRDFPLPDFAKLDEIVTEKTIGFIEMQKQLMSGEKDIEWAYKYTQACIALVDRGVGIIIDSLKQQNIYDDSIIIFSSDHGDMLGDFDMLCKWDQAVKSLVHIPFILKPDKGHQLPKEEWRAMSNADVLPTILHLVGIDIPEYMQGIDILDKEKESNPMVTAYNMKGIHRNISIFDDRYRYTYVTTSGEEELYDHIEDPKEYQNLAKDEKFRILCKDKKDKLLEKHMQCDIGIYQHYGIW